MPWKPLLQFSFENHAALDDTGHGFHGRVELPDSSRWIDTPAAGIPTAVRYDNPESKIVVGPRPEFAGWRGVRVRAYFKTADVAKRHNLVEGDGSFALFVEPGGVLRGTINDGSGPWWGLSSQPGCVKTGRWHFAEFLYDSGQVLTVSLDGQLLGTRITAGLPIQPVGAAGIRVGYWPGGDSRYTFTGLMGPIWIDTLDEREEVVEILNTLLCDGSDGTSRLEMIQAAMKVELTSAEQASVADFGGAVVGAVRRLAAVVVGQSQEPGGALDTILALADDLGRLTVKNENANTDLLKDPELSTLLGKVYAAARAGNPAAESAFTMEAMNLLAAFPLSPQRWQQIWRDHHQWCTTGFPPPAGLGADGGISGIDGWVDRYCNSGRCTGHESGHGRCRCPHDTPEKPPCAAEHPSASRCCGQ